MAVREGKISKGRLLQYGWHLATMDSLRLWTETFKQYTFGLFKVVNAPLAGIIDISDVFWTYILSYVWLNDSPTNNTTAGAIFDCYFYVD